ncbi:MAG: DHHA1 domain-containing protein [Zestosphaera sp.]
MRTVLITHTDLDGLASGALILKKLGSLDRVYFAQPHYLHSKLAGVPGGSTVYVTDLGVNSNTLDKVKEQVKKILVSGGKVYWFDHHVWEDSWIADMTKLGVDLYVDRTACSAWVVSKYLDVKDSDDLVRTACSVDLWLMNDWRGNYLSRYVGYTGGNAWKERALRKLAQFSGSVDHEIFEVTEKAITKELNVYSKALKKANVKECNGVKIVYYLKDEEEHLTSYIANTLIARYEADVAVICRRGSVSLRSREVDVREIAMRMGGGGHPKAAGASLRPSIIMRIMYVIGLKKFYAEWCVGKVLEHICIPNAMHSERNAQTCR